MRNIGNDLTLVELGLLHLIGRLSQGFGKLLCLSEVAAVKAHVVVASSKLRCRHGKTLNRRCELPRQVDGKAYCKQSYNKADINQHAPYNRYGCRVRVERRHDNYR